MRGRGRRRGRARRVGGREGGGGGGGELGEWGGEWGGGRGGGRGGELGEWGGGVLLWLSICPVPILQIWNHPDIYYNEAKAQESKRSSPVSVSCSCAF